MIRDFILFVVGEYVCSIVGGVGSHLIGSREE